MSHRQLAVVPVDTLGRQEWAADCMLFWGLRCSIRAPRGTHCVQLPRATEPARVGDSRPHLRLRKSDSNWSSGWHFKKVPSDLLSSGGNFFHLQRWGETRGLFQDPNSVSQVCCELST